MKELKNKLEAIFYCSGTGREPVREWLKSLSKEDKRILGEDIKTVQFGWPLGMPMVRSLSNGLWEVRSNLKSRRIARVLFSIRYSTIFLLHGFIKKSQTTLSSDINLALQRKKEIETR